LKELKMENEDKIEDFEESIDLLQNENKHLKEYVKSNNNMPEGLSMKQEDVYRAIQSLEEISIELADQDINTIEFDHILPIMKHISLLKLAIKQYATRETTNSIFTKTEQDIGEKIAYFKETKKVSKAQKVNVEETEEDVKEQKGNDEETSEVGKEQNVNIEETKEDGKEQKGNVKNLSEEAKLSNKNNADNN